MSKKNINNRLENLFSNLNEDNPQISPLNEVSIQLPSWSWETDSNGIYTQCNEEVARAIGLNPKDFVGSPLLSCHIVKTDRKNLLKLLQKDEFPFEVNLHVDGKNGKAFYTRFNVYKIVDSSTQKSIYRGYTQLLQEEEPLTNQPILNENADLRELHAADEGNIEKHPDNPVNEEKSEIEAEISMLQANNIIAANPPQEQTLISLEELEKELLKLSAEEIKSNNSKTVAETQESQPEFEIDTETSANLEPNEPTANTTILHDESLPGAQVQDIEGPIEDRVETLKLDRRHPSRNTTNPLENDAVDATYSHNKQSQRVVEPAVRRNRQEKPDFAKLSKTAPLGPLPNYPETGRGETAPLIPAAEINGVTLENDTFKPSENVWTQQALVSFQENVVVSSPANEESPAILVSPLKIRNKSTGVIELISSDSARKWTEEDRLLMQEISNQLGLALENAQLYSTVEKELGERIKAEQATERRNRDLAAINQIGQRLSRLVSPEEIFELVTAMLMNSLNCHNLLISILDDKHNTFAFPICISKGERTNLPPRELRDGYQESLLKSHAPLVINKDPLEFLNHESLDHPLKYPVSMVAVPLMAGDRGLGVITLLNNEPDQVFDHTQVELVSTVANQMATSLENATLFENIRTALETIEVRERYQSNVTKAVAQLTEKGSQSLQQILEYLALAAGCERTYFAKSELEKETGLVWTISDIYTSPSVDLSIHSNPNDQITAIDFPDILNDLSLQGWHTATVDTTHGSEKKYLQSRDIASILILAISSGGENKSFIAFENYNNKQEWQKEEISILQIASDALANTFIREELLKQVQSSLEETENLYSASHQLALSNTSQEMLSAIIQGSHAQVINRGILILFSYDESGHIEKMVVNANYYSGAGTPPPPVQTEYLVQLYSQAFVTRNPVFYDNVADSKIDKTLQDILIRQNIHSMAILPLWSGNRQSGVVMLITMVRYHFQDQEIRSLPPLADQMSTALENLRLYESTQEALAETELLYKISNGIAESTGLPDLVSLVGKNALPEGADTVHLLISDSSQAEALTNFAYVGCYSIDNEYTPINETISGSAFSSFDLNRSDPIQVPVSRSLSENKEFKAFLDELNCSTLTIIPLNSSGLFLGLLLCSSQKELEFPKDQLQTLQIVANSISVGIERQRLLTETQRRALELQAAAELARDTTSTLSLDILLNRIVNLLQERFGFYHTAIYLVDDTDMFLTIQEATGTAGVEMKKRQNRIAIGSKSAIGLCAASGNPQMINDSSASQIFYSNPLLPESRSELVLPLKISDKVTGVIDIHSKRTNAFSISDITVFQILSDQVSIAIENAHAYEISQKAVEDMRELDRVKSQFLANMSHELRTPLNSVIGFSRVILKGIDGPINDVQKQDIGSIYSSGMHLLNMINEILDMSKIDAGKMELQTEASNISDVINSTISSAMGLVKDKSINIVQKVAPDLPLVKMDQIRIGQVLTNLIANAVKFTEKGSIVVGADLSSSPEGKPEIMVTVTDSGIGIAPEDQTKLFQRFSQVDDSPTRKTGGTGLGLSICRSLVELHNGRIGLLSSEVGKGSTFFFTLPLEEPKDIPSLEQLSHEQNVILSIDDDAQVIALYDRYLENSGFHIIAETDPEKAVERAIEVQPMAITLDIMMPKKDGWQVMRDLKQNEKTRDIPILICSILEEDEKGISLGAADYLVKPFLQDDLIKAIHRISNGTDLRKVLVIDDDASDLRLTQKMLENNGAFVVSTANDGREALESLTNETPDLIILDLFMPGLNGFDLLEIFRADPNLGKIPVIILTGADLNIEQQKQLSDFGQHLMNKGSLKEQELLSSIEESLQKIKSSQLHG
jgi:K+-sensing histidine kinase KdpD/DNA-binding response OmpR family regulator